MMTDKPLKIAFLLSAGIHSLLFSPLVSFLNEPVVIDNTKIEVNYVDIKDDLVSATKPILMEDKKLTLEKERMLPSKKEPPSKVEKPQGENRKEPAEKSKEAAQERIIKQIRKDADFNPSYIHDGFSESLNYLNDVRNKINIYIHAHYVNSMGEGEALVHFVVNRNGAVQSASIVKDNFKDNEDLRSLCLDGIHLSSPFKPFPKGLDLPEASFNITISLNI